ncbi:MAG: DUF1592 domain-containing protein [Verrucomicrobiales bacterium]|nr:DUF1592 domain-containing protein [Verrucomicrobiales bacterium]
MSGLLRRLGLAAWLGAGLGPAIAPTASAADGVESFLKRHCYECHDADSRKGGLNLESLAPGGSEASAHDTWVRIHDRVVAGEMPPAKAERPPAAESAAFVEALAKDLRVQHAIRKGTVLRRLNRREYRNTVNALLGTDLDLTPYLPEDGRAHGFDTVGEALHLSSIQLQRYMEAAEAALNASWHEASRPETRKGRYGLGDDERSASAIGKSWLRRPDGAVVVFTSDRFPATFLPTFRASAAGRYRVKLTGYGYQTRRAVTFSLVTGSPERGGEQSVRGFHEFPPDRPGVVEVELGLGAGDALKILPFGLQGVDGHSPTKDGPDKYPGEGLALLGAEIEGPLLEEWPRRGRRALLGDARVREVPPRGPSSSARRDYRPAYAADVDDPRAAARAGLARFLPMAFRRPLRAGDMEPFVELVNGELAAGVPFLDAMRTGAIAVLSSPDFLFLREPEGTLDAYALASRLSYFLTRTGPDDTLLRLAETGELLRSEVLRAQTERLLGGANADRFVEDFCDGWLNLRDIEFTTPDKLLYPEFDDFLLFSMPRETRAFVGELFRANLGIAELIRSEFAMLNSRLATHYGLVGVEGPEIRKVTLPPKSRRGGVLTQAAVMKVTANGTSTSPVTRGVWVLERLLGITPPPPPPGIPGVEPDTRGARTVREILARHRSVESCNGCHRTIDPPGFALESYDVIGGWRERFRVMNPGSPRRLVPEGPKVRYRDGPAVDAAGQLPDGQRFGNFEEFRTLLLEREDDVARCVAEKLLIFGTGRPMGFSDRLEIDRIVAGSKTRKHGMRDLLHAVVASEIFRSK